MKIADIISDYLHIYKMKISKYYIGYKARFIYYLNRKDIQNSLKTVE